MSTTSVYSVSIFHNGYYISTSNYFDSSKSAQEFMEYCKTMDTSQLQFQMYKCKCEGEPQTINTTPTKTTPTKSTKTTVETDLSNMTLEKYGKGFLLRPSEDSDLYGVKLFLNGWWMPKHHAWFFKSSYFDELIMAGVEYISESLVEDYVSEDDEDYSETQEATEDELEYNSEDDSVDYGSSIQGLALERYGKGWMLYPDNKSHEFYGEKYFGDGFWNTKAKGWFFRDMYVDDLLAAGACMIEEDEMVLSETESDSEIMGSWKTYGKGWLFKPLKKHPNFGDKYYKSGWWMTTQKAWFFKTSDAEKLH